MNDAWAFSSLGSLINRCYHDALEQWAYEHAPHLKLDEVMAGHIIEVSIDTSIYPLGRAMIVTSVLARKRWDDESFVVRAHRGESGKWLIRNKS